jgi:hypothetical protein
MHIMQTIYILLNSVDAFIVSHFRVSILCSAQVSSIHIEKQGFEKAFQIAVMKFVVFIVCGYCSYIFLLISLKCIQFY